MKKLLFIMILLVMLTLTACGYDEENNEFEKPNDFTFDLWIGDNVDEFDFTGYSIVYKYFQYENYLDKNYQLTNNENKLPEYYVTYDVTPYPDYTQNNMVVTKVIISDPNVSFYGLTVNSSIETIQQKFTDMGFKYEDGSFKKDDVIIYYNQNLKVISFSLNVSNEGRINY